VLTISQLAAYAGVTVRAVRHYHAIGLLPEAERNESGYRTYGAAAVVRLIRINTLARAGVPLARVHQLLDASDEEFADGVRQIDDELRVEIRRLQQTRRRLTDLAAGDHLALPSSVVGYLDRLRRMGVEDRYLDMERGAWILIAAQAPAKIDAIIAAKHAELDDPDVIRLYGLLNGALDWWVDDPRIIEVADIMERLMIRAVETGETGADDFDDQLVALLDATTVESSPAARRLLAILEQRGWKGWTRIERAPVTRRGREC
jgi:DNA-binding transcriptional MerR regulator